jgi:hypothetical protein
MLRQQPEQFDTCVANAAQKPYIDHYLSPVETRNDNRQSPEKQKSRPWAAFLGKQRELALRELLATAGLVEADLLTLDFTSIAGNKPGFRQRRLQRSIVLNQGTSDAVANRTGLARFTTAINVNHDIEGTKVLDELQRLANHHAAGFTREEGINRLAVNDDCAIATLHEDTSDRAFATTRTIKIIFSHLTTS